MEQTVSEMRAELPARPLCHGAMRVQVTERSPRSALDRSGTCLGAPARRPAVRFTGSVAAGCGALGAS